MANMIVVNYAKSGFLASISLDGKKYTFKPVPESQAKATHIILRNIRGMVTTGSTEYSIRMVRPIPDSICVGTLKNPDTWVYKVKGDGYFTEDGTRLSEHTVEKIAH
jgi:hypothetical protein